MEVIMKTYKTTAIKSGKYWHLDIEGFIQGTQARTLAEAEEMAKDFINGMTDEALENIAIDLTIQLPEEVAEVRADAERLFEQAKLSNALAAERSRQAAKMLREQGLTLKDIGQVLDVSYQRVAQLVA